MDQFRGLSPAGTRDLLVTHSLAYAATIQLHKNFTSRNANSNPKCLAAAAAIVTILDHVDLSELTFINPIMGVRWDLSQATSLTIYIYICDADS